MFLVFDIGGTKMRLATSQDGQSLEKQKIIPTPDDFEEVLLQFKLAAQDLSRGEKIQAAGGGIRGILDKNKSKLTKDHILTDFVDKPLQEKIAEITNSSVFLENDTALVGLGEATQGAGKGQKIIAYLTISTGVGGVRIVDNQIDANSLGFEPGHQIIVTDGNLCGCGGKGHLEAYISGSALEKIYHQKPQYISDPLIWDEVVKYLTVGLNNVSVHWSPDIIILGGSVGLSLPLDKIRKYFQQTLIIFPEAPQIAKASLGDQAGLLGALAYLKQHGH